MNIFGRAKKDAEVAVKKVEALADKAETLFLEVETHDPLLAKALRDARDQIYADLEQAMRLHAATVGSLVDKALKALAVAGIKTAA